MKIYDISMKIYYDMPVYKNKDKNRPVTKIISDFTKSSSYSSNVNINMHTGTHVDAPLHMLEDGSTIDNLDLNNVIGKCQVVDLTHLTEKITEDHLKEHSINKNDIILFKTKNSDYNYFDSNFIYLDKSGAVYLKNKKIKSVGIDSLGIERAQPDHETHKILLSSGISIIEGLKLKDISEGHYFLFAAPLFIAGAEAAPARAVLIEDL